MKPSQRIANIVQEMISSEWVRSAGQHIPRESWQMFCEQDLEKHMSLMCQAIVQYLDESINKDIK